jgi:hypothetical protein
MASSFSNSEHFDEVRGAWVAATPEEDVRQKVLKKMIYGLGFPKELIAVEKELKELPHLAGRNVPQRRIDVLCYGKEIHPKHSLYPLLLIECKRDVLDEAAEAQLIGYNAHVGAYFILLAGEKEERFGYLNNQTRRYTFQPGFPAFNHLLTWLRQN